MAKIVVTGGAGFIGTHLVKKLQSLNHEVEVIDIATDQKRDVRNLEAIKNIFVGAEYVFHLAALTSVEFSIKHPVETNQTNLNGTLNVLNAAKEAGVKRVIFSSSASVYGEQDKLPIEETAELRPMSPYALHKFASEEYLKLFSNIYDLETVALRYFNVYGEGQNPDDAYASVIPKFLSKRKEGKPLAIIGDGNQTRDFVHVADVVRANILAMQSENVGKGEAFNIASGSSISIKEVATIFGGSVDYLPPRLEIKNSRANIEKAKSVLGWEPQVKLEDGLKTLLSGILR